ncbi:MAG TPA: AlpA family phage regulatory protein [Syntrophales bacterium]|nr:AlpA family phage regulatory protein [Syntrophales bacterium]
MNDIPQDRLLRIKQVLEIIPVSRSTWWAGVREGRFPKPFKLSPRVTVWRSEDVLKIVAKQK